jgi:tetratricopeptide (TPR) repeat protein
MKISSRNAALLVAVFLATNTGAAEPEQFLAAGDEALARFDLDAALASYQHAHAAAAKNYEAAWKLARAFADKATLANDHSIEQNQCCRQAEQFARLAIRLNPSDSKGHTYLAIAVGKLALYEGGKRKVELSKEVQTEAEAALRLSPRDDLAHHVLGVWNREMTQLNWMLRKFAELLYGKFPPASLDESVNQLSRAAELAPAVVAHPVELGITLAAAKRWSESAQQLRTALAMPTTWVTDAHYRSLANRTLVRVEPNLK